MKKTKKTVLALALAIIMCILLLAACGDTNEVIDGMYTVDMDDVVDTPPPEDLEVVEGTDEVDVDEVDADDRMFTIGVIQLMEHVALQATFDGMVDALAANGYIEGENLTILYDNAHGDHGTLATIADRYVTHGVDLVVSISTPASQAIAARTDTIPILGTAVTSFVVAGLVDSNELPGGNISGVSDMNPVGAQIDLIVELVPDVQTIGLIYNAGEANSVFQIELAKEYIEALGLDWHEVTVADTGDVMQAMQSLVGRVDAVYIPTDNTVASAMAAVHSVAMESGTPVIAGEAGMVREGGLATLGIDYYYIGWATGLMAIEVLHGANPGEMPIRFSPPNYTVTINGLVAEEIGFTVPERFLDYVIIPE